MTDQSFCGNQKAAGSYDKVGQNYPSWPIHGGFEKAHAAMVLSIFLCSVCTSILFFSCAIIDSFLYSCFCKHILYSLIVHLFFLHFLLEQLKCKIGLCKDFTVFTLAACSL